MLFALFWIEVLETPSRIQSYLYSLLFFSYFCLFVGLDDSSDFITADVNHPETRATPILRIGHPLRKFQSLPSNRFLQIHRQHSDMLQQGFNMHFHYLPLVCLYERESVGFHLAPK